MVNVGDEGSFSLSFAEGAIIIFFTLFHICGYVYIYVYIYVKLLGGGEKKTHHVTTTCNLPHSLTVLAGSQLGRRDCRRCCDDHCKCVMLRRLFRGWVCKSLFF